MNFASRVESANKQFKSIGGISDEVLDVKKECGDKRLYAYHGKRD